jgi:hypothetical protein
MARTIDHDRVPDRVRELLAVLQLGLCGRCGRARYATRTDARRAARIAAPGNRLRAYRCGTSWHLTTPAGTPQLITPPVTPVQHPAAAGRRGLDRRRGGERAYRRSGLERRGGPQDAPRRSRRGGTDPLEDTHDHTTPARGRPPARRRSLWAAGGGR